MLMSKYIEVDFKQQGGLCFGNFLYTDHHFPQEQNNVWVFEGILRRAQRRPAAPYGC